MPARTEGTCVSLVEEQLNAVIDSTPDPFIIVDADGTIQRINREAEHFFGYKREELIGRSYKILVPERFRSQHDSYTRKYREQPEMREMGSGLELFCLHRSGTEIQVEIGLSPVVVKGSTTIMVRFRDIRSALEEEKILREALRKADDANRTKSRFLAAASHDLRQPLQSISMYLGVLAEMAGDEENIVVIEKCRASVDTTNRLLDALLNITMLESGKVQPVIEDFNIGALLRRVWNTEAPHARKKHHNLVVIDSSVTVSSDPALLEQIITNYVANAIKYTPAGGHIVVGCRRTNGQLRVQVCDNGPGIPASELNKIFDEYRQLEDTLGYRGKGLGLGLSIVKLIAQLLSLKLEVKSTLPKGSCFSVLVPLAERQSGRSATQVTARPQQRKGTGVILLIDDDPAVLDSTSLFLRLSGYTVIVASSPDEAMAAIATTQPDLVVTDYGLAKKETGIELLIRLRTVLGRDVPAIVMTGDSSELRAREARELNCELLRKPVDVHVLLQLLRESSLV